jgi:HEAT repeat protein
MSRLVLFLVFALLLGRQITVAHSAVIVPADPDARRGSPTPAVILQSAVRNVRGLIAAVRGLPPVVCGLTAEAASGWGGRSWYNAPSPPLGAETAERVTHFPRGRLTLAEIRLLIDSLSTTDPCVREVSIRMIGRVNAAAVEEPLISRLDAATPLPTREAAALGLGLVRSKAAVDPLLRTARDSETGLRANAVWALGRIGEKRVAPEVRRTLTDDEDLVRGAAAGALGSLDDQESIEDLLRVLRSDPAANVRRIAAWALGTIEARDAAEGIVTALRSERDEDVREMCVWALGNIEAKTSVSALVDLLRRDTNEEVREMAAWALGEIEDAAATPALGEAAGGDSNAEVRGTAAWALGQIGARGAPAGLIRAVNDTDEDVRTRAAWALSEIGDTVAIPALRQALRTERDGTARRAQLRALVRSGERSEEFFRDLLRSEDPDVRAEAVRGMAGRGHSNPWPWPMPRPRPFP